GLQSFELVLARRTPGVAALERLVESRERRLGVGDDAEGRPLNAGDLDRVNIDSDQLQVAVEAPASLRLVKPGADGQHDIGVAPHLVAGERWLGKIMAVADYPLAAGKADD